MGRTKTKKVTTCHPDRVHYCKGLCRKCYHNLYNKRYLRDPEKKARANRLTVDWRKNRSPKDYERGVQLRYLYGISLEDYYSLLDKQGGGCAICKQPPKSYRALAVDHCHETGKIRGLLCDTCNQKIGTLEMRDWLLTASAYLEESNTGLVIPENKLGNTNQRNSSVLRGM